MNRDVYTNAAKSALAYGGGTVAAILGVAYLASPHTAYDMFGNFNPVHKDATVLSMGALSLMSFMVAREYAFKALESANFLGLGETETLETGYSPTNFITLFLFISFMQVINIPFGVGSLGKNNLTKNAPKAIQESVKEIFLTELEKVPVFKFEEIKVDESDVDQAPIDIQNQAEQFLKNATQPLCFVGGDHSITYATFQAYAKTQPKDDQGRSMSGMIIVDAHPDLMQSFDPPTHENYLRCLIEKGVVDPRKIILIGIRAWDKEEAAFIKQNGIRNYDMKSIAEHGFKEIIFNIMEQVRNWHSAYLSIDIDGVDPAFAPGTGYAEPGGISSRDLIQLIHKLKLLNNIRCYDLVEINPEKDINNMDC